jgi:hypothetical protein
LDDRIILGLVKRGYRDRIGTTYVPGIQYGETMARRLNEIKEIKIERPKRAKLSAEESLKRTQDFDKRKDKFIASIRKGKG